MSLVNEVIWQLKNKGLHVILNINFLFIFSRKKIITINLHSINHIIYVQKISDKLKLNPKLKVVFISSNFYDKNVVFIKKNAKIIFSDLHISTLPYIELSNKTSSSKTILFQHSLLSIFCEPPTAFKGFNYIFTPSKSLHKELHLHLKTESKLIPSFYERLEEEKVNKIHKKTKKIILIAITRSDLTDSLEKSMPIIKEIIKYNEIIFRPHPIDFIYNKNKIEDFISEFSNENNFKLDKSKDIKTAMKISDCMISDWSGSSIHYLLCYKKPVLFIDSKYPFKTFNSYSKKMKKLFKDSLELKIRDELGEIIYGKENNNEISIKFNFSQEKINKSLKSFKKEMFFSKTNEDNYKEILNIIKCQN